MAKKPEANLLDLVPCRIVDWEDAPKNRIDLIVPKFKSAFIQKWIKQLGKSTVARIHLDDFGSYVWQCCNEQNTIYEIGQKLRNTFGESVEPVFDRLSGFMRLLVHHKYVILSPDKQQ